MTTSAGRQRVDRRNVGVGEADFLALGIQQLGRRAQVPTAHAALLRIHDQVAGEAGDLVHLLGDRDLLDEVLELQKAADFGDHRMGVRIPGRDDLAAIDLGAIVDIDDRAVRDPVALALAAVLVDHADFAGAADRDEVALLVAHRLDVVQANRARAA